MNRSSPHRYSILVLHHDPLLRAGLVSALRENGPFDVHVAGPEATGQPLPAIDVVVADYANAVRLANQGGARILTLTSNDREADIRRAIEAGVHGYLLVGGSINELVDGAMTVANGARYLCRSVAQRMADSMSHAALTSRETEVLQFVVSGESNKAIARQLNIELGTVKSHVSAIMTKLGAASRTQAAGIASARGLVREPQAQFA